MLLAASCVLASFLLFYLSTLSSLPCPFGPAPTSQIPGTKFLIGDLNLSLLCLTLGRWGEKARVIVSSDPFKRVVCLNLEDTVSFLIIQKFSDFILSY